MKGIVRIPFRNVQTFRTDSARCTKNAQLGKIEGVKVDAHQVVQRYVANLRLTGRFKSIQELAEAMDTSRTQVYEMLATGKMMTKHVNGLALALKTDASAIYGEMQGLAQNMRDGIVQPITKDELKLILKQRRKKAKRGAAEIDAGGADRLPGADGRALINVDRHGKHGATSADETPKSSKQPRRMRKRPGQNPDPQR